MRNEIKYPRATFRTLVKRSNRFRIVQIKIGPEETLMDNSKKWKCAGQNERKWRPFVQSQPPCLNELRTIHR